MAIRRPLLVAALIANLGASVWLASRTDRRLPGAEASVAAPARSARRPADEGRSLTSPGRAAPSFCEAERAVLNNRLRAGRATVDNRRPLDWNFDSAAPNVQGTQAVMTMARAFLTDNPAGKKTALGQAVASGARTPDQLMNVECRGDSCRMWRAAAEEAQFNEFAQAFTSYSPELKLAARDRNSLGVTGLRFRLAESSEVAIRTAFRDLGRVLRQQAKTCEAEHGIATGVLQFIIGSGSRLEGSPTYGDERLWYSIAGTLTGTKVAACIETAARSAVDQLSGTLAEAPYPMEQIHNVIARLPANG
jgi:hypothetical protein